VLECKAVRAPSLEQPAKHKHPNNLNARIIRWVVSRPRSATVPKLCTESIGFPGDPSEHMMIAQLKAEVVIANTFVSVLTPEDKHRKLLAAPRSKSAGARMQSSEGSIVGAANKAQTFEQPQRQNYSMGFEQASECESSQPSDNQVMDGITTAMVRNIPYQYNIEELLAEFEELGLRASYNFVFLPPGNKKRQNLGYAFVNLLSPEMYSHFVQALTSYRFKKNSLRRCKPVTVKSAAVQGLHANVKFARQTSKPSAFFLPENEDLLSRTSVS